MKTWHQDVQLGLQISPKHFTPNLGQNFILKPSIDLKSFTYGHNQMFPMCSHQVFKVFPWRSQKHLIFIWYVLAIIKLSCLNIICKGGPR